MRILMIAGGSGGHIYPCLELAKYFKEQGEDVFVGGNNNSLEESIYKNNNLDFIGVDIDKKRFSSHFKNLKKIRDVYRKYNFDAVLLFGNYISFSFGLSAYMHKIPIYLHEQNVIYGRANKLLGLKARKIFLSLPIENDKYSKKSMLLGNPKSESETSKVNLDKSKYNVIVTMGSLGSSTVNEMMKKFIENINDDKIIYHIVVGKKYYDNFVRDLTLKPNIIIYPYLENLSSYIKECDLFVSRAGATTISEIINTQTISILIPSPYVKDNHQYHNAKYLYDNNACFLIEEKDVDGRKLKNTIDDILNDRINYFKMKNNLKNIKLTNIRKNIYEEIKNDLT